MKLTHAECNKVQTDDCCDLVVTCDATKVWDKINLRKFKMSRLERMFMTHNT